MQAAFYWVEILGKLLFPGENQRVAGRLTLLSLPLPPTWNDNVVSRGRRGASLSP